ncbi:NAD-dependent malic enzyme [bacterium]|nr:NAD-dependent malic enzyme [bacterium]
MGVVTKSSTWQKPISSDEIIGLSPETPSSPRSSTALQNVNPKATGPRTTELRGPILLHSPILNKGTAFSEEERSSLGLKGLLPPHIETLEEQIARAYEAYQAKDTDLERHINLRALQDTNEVLFYRLLMEHVEEMLPILYTPTVGLACQRFSHIYRRNRGLFISYTDRDEIRTILRNRPNKEVDVIVVTDGERILGIGDQGVGGLGIPIGKLSLYTLIGGIHPERTLPIVLDVGTNNTERQEDPDYFGWRHPRVTGQEYDDFIDAFVTAVKEELPSTILQWEDFATPHAYPILQRYRDQLLTFNDDIQGTAAVALGAILGAVAATKNPIRDQQIVFLGAGSAAIGVATLLRKAMVNDGLTDEEAKKHFWIIDVNGLLHDGRTDLTAEQNAFAQAESVLSQFGVTNGKNVGLEEVIKQINATILIGLSTVGGTFKESIVKEMASKVDRPVIFPLSNPTAHSEAVPSDLIEWTNGRALIATGSPFAPVNHGGQSIPIAQCNNVFIFPAIGLGVVASQATRVTDGMILAAARALGEHSPARTSPTGSLLPDVSQLRTVAVAIAHAVGLAAQKDGVAPKCTEAELLAKVQETQWTPAYREIIPASE